MKTDSKLLLVSLLLLGVMSMTGCNALSQMIKASKDNKLTVTPSPLEVHADSVTFEISATLPAKLLKPKKVFTVNTYYLYGTEEQELQSVVFKSDDYPDSNTRESNITQTYTFPFKEGMERGNIEIKGIASDPKTGAFKETEWLKIAEGLITTSRLVQPSYAASQSSQTVSYANHGYNDQEELIPTNVEFYFDQGRSVFKQTKKINTANVASFTSFIANKNVTRTVSITGTHSPEGKESINEELSQERAATIEAWYREQMDKYDYKDMADQVSFTLKPISQNWKAFKHMLSEYDGISSAQKSEYTDIINGTGSFEQKEKQLQRLSTYNKVFKDIYPTLRTAKTEALTVKPKKSKEEIAILALQIANGSGSADELSVEEMLYAVANNPSLKEKKKILEAAAKKDDTWVVHNNLGAANLAMAIEGEGNAEDLVTTALNHFEISNQKNISVEAQANIGVALAMQGNFWGAHSALTKALGMNPNNDVRQAINSTKGYVEIKLGQYDLAMTSLRGAGNSSVNQFNKGLVQLLSKDFKNAQTTWEGVISADKGFVVAHYAAAVAAARQSDENKVIEHLRNAVNADANLKQKALKDLEFQAYASNQAFIDLMK